MSLAIFKMQFRHMLSRSEFRISLTVVLCFIAAAFFTLSGEVRGHDVNAVYSAAYGWVGYADALMIHTMQAFYMLFLLLLGAFAFSDSHFVDKKIRVRDLVVTRCPRSAYIRAGACVSFIGAFLVIFVPFALSQLLSFILFPLSSSVPIFRIQDASYAPSMFMDYSLFPRLFCNQPYLYNLVAILYMSFCAGAGALLSFACSFCFKRGRLLIVAIPEVLLIIQGVLGLLRPTFDRYLNMDDGFDYSLTVYFVVPLLALAAGCALLFVHIRLLRDELS